MRVQCPSCSKVYPVTAKNAGRKAQCNCGTILKMPQLSQQVAQADVAQKIEMTCEGCDRRLSVPADAVGKLVQCPCGLKSPIPAAGAALQPANNIGASSGSFGNDPFASDSFASDSFASDPFGPPAESGSYENEAFDSASSDGYGLAMGPAYLTTPAPRKKTKPKKKKASSSGYDGPDMGQVLSGLGMMLGAVVWFFGGLFFGVIFIYPPILLIVGFFTMIKGFISP